MCDLLKNSLKSEERSIVFIWLMSCNHVQELAAALDRDEDNDTGERIKSHSLASTKEEEDKKKKPPPKKKKVKLSTGIKLLSTADHPSSSDRVSKSAKSHVTPSAQLSPYHEVIQAFMASQGHTEPTPIQQQCWTPCCLGKDVQGIAEPGSGKTLAYLLPGFVRLKVRSQTTHDNRSFSFISLS